MGNQQSDNCQGYIEDSRFGLIRIEQFNKTSSSDDLGSQDSTEVIVLRNDSMSSGEYEKWKKKLSLYKELREILFLPLETCLNRKSFCGGNCTIELRYPMYRILLREEIINRCKINKPYEETEIWYLLYNLVALGKHFQKFGHKIGDIHPNNIVINEKGLMKVIGFISLPTQQNNFIKICDSQINDAFLAPQQIDHDCFQRYKYPPGVNQNSAEIFSMGMTILEAGTLQLSTYVYDKGPYKLNYPKLRNNLQIFRSIYSRGLSAIVESMISQKPSSRKSCRDIYTKLRPYENEILNLEDFTLGSQIKSIKANKGDSLVYSSANSQISSALIPSNLLDSKKVGSIVSVEQKPPSMNPEHSQKPSQHPNQKIVPQLSKIRSDQTLRRYDLLHSPRY